MHVNEYLTSTEAFEHGTYDETDHKHYTMNDIESFEQFNETETVSHDATLHVIYGILGILVFCFVAAICRVCWLLVKTAEEYERQQEIDRGQHEVRRRFATQNRPLSSTFPDGSRILAEFRDPAALTTVPKHTGRNLERTTDTFHEEFNLNTIPKYTSINRRRFHTKDQETATSSSTIRKRSHPRATFYPEYIENIFSIDSNPIATGPGIEGFLPDDILAMSSPNTSPKYARHNREEMTVYDVQNIFSPDTDRDYEDLSDNSTFKSEDFQSVSGLRTTPEPVRERRFFPEDFQDLLCGSTTPNFGIPTPEGLSNPENVEERFQESAVEHTSQSSGCVETKRSNVVTNIDTSPTHEDTRRERRFFPEDFQDLLCRSTTPNFEIPTPEGFSNPENVQERLHESAVEHTSQSSGSVETKRSNVVTNIDTSTHKDTQIIPEMKSLSSPPSVNVVRRQIGKYEEHLQRRSSLQ